MAYDINPPTSLHPLQQIQQWTNIYYMHLPASCVVTAVVVVDVNPVAVLVAVTRTTYRMPASRLLIITEPVVLVPILVGILVQALLVSVAVYWFAGRLFVG